MGRLKTNIREVYMLKYLAAFAVVAVTAMALSLGTVVVTKAGYNGAEPSKKGNMCFKYTDGRGEGYWAPCPHK